MHATHLVPGLEYPATRWARRLCCITPYVTSGEEARQQQELHESHLIPFKQSFITPGDLDDASSREQWSIAGRNEVVEPLRLPQGEAGACCRLLRPFPVDAVRRNQPLQEHQAQPDEVWQTLASCAFGRRRGFSGKSAQPLACFERSTTVALAVSGD